MSGWSGALLLNGHELRGKGRDEPMRCLPAFAQPRVMIFTVEDDRHRARVHGAHQPIGIAGEQGEAWNFAIPPDACHRKSGGRGERDAMGDALAADGIGCMRPELEGRCRDQAAILRVAQRADPEWALHIADMGDGRTAGQGHGGRRRHAPQARHHPLALPRADDDRAKSTGRHIAALPGIVPSVREEALRDLRCRQVQAIEGGHCRRHPLARRRSGQERLRSGWRIGHIAQ